jgi:hypothetical protein
MPHFETKTASGRLPDLRAKTASGRLPDLRAKTASDRAPFRAQREMAPVQRLLTRERLFPPAPQNGTGSIAVLSAAKNGTGSNATFRDENGIGSIARFASKNGIGLFLI